MTAANKEADVLGMNHSRHDSGTRAMSWSLTLLVCVICSLFFASTAEGASLSIDAGDQNVANPQLDINANTVWALMFSVKMP